MKIGNISFESIHVSGDVGFDGLHEVLADQLVDLYDGLEPDDLISNGLTSKALQYYSDVESARSRIYDLLGSRLNERPVGAYAVLDCTRHTDEGMRPILGTATFARSEEPLATKITDRIFKRESGVRYLTSMLRTDRIADLDLDKIMEGCVEVAQNSGLVAVRAAVVNLDGKPSDKVVVLEHAVDLKTDFGFEEVGEEEVIIEGAKYPSTVFERSL